MQDGDVSVITPLGLPNLGATCWLNSALQLFLYSTNVKGVIEAGKKSLNETPLHCLLSNVLTHVQERKEPYEIINVYRELYRFVITLQPEFASNALNDAHEVITCILNQLHLEAGREIPSTVLSQVKDPVSLTILRDFNNRVSNILEVSMGVTSTKLKDETLRYETFITLFVDILDQETQTNDLQKAISNIQFHSVPRSLFLQLIVHDQVNASVNLPDELYAGGGHFVIRGMIMFIPHMRHYITAIRGKIEQQNVWCIFNDANVTYITPEQLASVQAIPTLIMYETSTTNII